MTAVPIRAPNFPRRGPKNSNSMTIMIEINQLYTIRKEILRATGLHWAFWKIFKILLAGGNSLKFQKSDSFIFNFLNQTKDDFDQTNTSFKGLEEGNKILGSFLLFVKNVIFAKITEIFNFRLKRKNDSRILFLSSRPFKWCICLFKRKWRN